MALDGKQVFEIISSIAADEEKRDEITVLPLMCGSGKSTAISYMIKKTIEEADDTGNGLLVVTDRNDRMADYMEPHDDVLRSYLTEHQNEVVIMTHENIEEAHAKKYFAPVLMMTTQRYFRLSIEEINHFLQWEKGVRPLVLFDEIPELKTIVELDGRKLAECDEALQASFQKNNYLSLEVQKTIEHYRKFIYELDNSDKCNQRDKLYCFWSWCNENELANFKGIFDVSFEEISKNKNTINSFGGGESYEDVYTRIKAIRMMENEKALFSHKLNIKKELFTDKLCMILDNYSLVKNINAKAIILDGTADLSPEYSIDSYKTFDSMDHRRPLNKLTIKIIDMPTAKYRLGDSKYRKILLDCVKLYWEEKIAPFVDSCEQWAIFSYKRFQKDLEREFDKGRIEHFGNIKGKNDFGKAKHIMQIGLNRFPDEIYYLFYLAHHPEMTAQFENANYAYNFFDVNLADYYEGAATIDGKEINRTDFAPDITQTIEELDDERIIAQSIKIEEQMKEYTGQTREIMNNMLLAEIEQNLFRGIIRNSDSEEEFTFHLFINKNAYGDLINLMQKRYGELGANIVDESIPIRTVVDKIMKRKGETNPKKMIDWHDRELKDGQEYTSAMIREVLGMRGGNAVKQYERMLERCRVLRVLLQNERKTIDDKEIRGYYVKRQNWH